MKRRGFTLVEALLAIALVAMLSGSVFAFLWSLIGRRDVLQQRSLEMQAGTAFIERIESDVLCGIAGDESAGAGVAGTATSLKLLTRGVWLPVAGERPVGDLQASEYVFDSGELRGRRWLAGAAAPALETISGRVQRVRFRYFDGGKWVESFDSAAAGALPVAIEVGVWFGEAAPKQAGADPKSEVVREPDRLRVIVVPDGPVTAGKETR